MTVEAEVATLETSNHLPRRVAAPKAAVLRAVVQKEVGKAPDL